MPYGSARGGRGSITARRLATPRTLVFSIARIEDFFDMSRENRLRLIKEIEAARNSNVICYLTSIRPGVAAQIADDQVRVIFDHLLALGQRPINKLDIFLVSNGGSGVVPWRLVSLFREFAKSFNVLIPYRAYSAASLIALGADEIVMHPFGELGPIDPSVSNDFNPKKEGGIPIPISVEDVKAYVNFVKKTVGITHEDELVETIKILATQVHPLALGNVERFVSQSRMIATKILKTHQTEKADHIINEMVENMTSKLYFHGHPINRGEAKNDLGLAVCSEVTSALETAMWDLYLDYEEYFENTSVFNPQGDLFSMVAPQGTPGPLKKEYEHVYAVIESVRIESALKAKRRFVMTQTPQGIQVMEQLLSQAWTHQHAEAAIAGSQSSSKGQAGVQ
jgi:Serine dehydrogenase proteinase